MSDCNPQFISRVQQTFSTYRLACHLGTIPRPMTRWKGWIKRWNLHFAVSPFKIRFAGLSTCFRLIMRWTHMSVQPPGAPLLRRHSATIPLWVLILTLISMFPLVEDHAALKVSRDSMSLSTKSPLPMQSMGMVIHYTCSTLLIVAPQFIGPHTIENLSAYLSQIKTLPHSVWAEPSSTPLPVRTIDGQPAGTKALVWQIL